MDSKIYFVAIIALGLLFFGCLGQPAKPTGNVTQNVTTPTTTNCSTNESCFYTNLALCSPTVFETDGGSNGQALLQITVKGPKDDKCSVEILMLKWPATTNVTVVGTSMECDVPHNTTTKDTFGTEFGPFGNSILKSCSGTYIEVLKSALHAS